MTKTETDSTINVKRSVYDAFTKAVFEAHGSLRGKVRSEAELALLARIEKLKKGK